MKLSLFFRMLGICFCLGYTHMLPVNAQNQSTGVVPYTIKAGETTFRIAREHGITVSQLLALNPGMKAEQIQANMVINLPRQNGTAGPSQQNPQDQVTYKEYKVKRKDTAYSLAKANNITVDELMQANPQLMENGYKLKKGTIIRIPLKSKTTAHVQPQGLDTIRLAVILPFIGNKDENIRSIEFYQGILLGVEELKKANKSIFISVYNEPHVNESITPLMRKVMLKRPDVIVGPLYPSHFSDVSAHASAKTKVAIPFSSKVKQVNYTPNVFAFNTPALHRNDIGIDLFTSSFKQDVNIIFLHKNQGDKQDFCSSLQTEVIKKGYNLTSLPASSTAEDIRKAIMNKKGKDFVIVPDDSSIETLKELMPKMESLRLNLPKKNFSLLGYSPWIELSEGEGRKKFHETDIYILAPNYYFPYTRDAIAFNTKYQQWFKSGLLNIYPRMAPLGYDFSIGFLGGIATYGYSFGNTDPRPNTVAALPKLQNEMRFVLAQPNGGYVNRSMWLVHFRNDMTITKTSAR